MPAVFPAEPIPAARVLDLDERFGTFEPIVLGVSMNECVDNGAKGTLILDYAELISYEIVHSETGLFVSVNGGCIPSLCDGFSVDNNRCFVLTQGFNEFISAQIPPQLSALIAKVNELIFVNFRLDGTIDANCLPRFALPVIH